MIFSLIPLFSFCFLFYLYFFPLLVWQHPYIDVFKTLNIYDGKQSRCFGDCKQILDSILCRRVFQIRGSVSANNFLELPPNNNNNNSNLNQSGGNGSLNSSSISNNNNKENDSNYIFGTSSMSSSGIANNNNTSIRSNVSNNSTNSSSSTGSRVLGLTGKFIYLQIRTIPERYFTIHIDILTTSLLTVRLSFSNLYKEIKVLKNGRCLQIPCHFLSTKWTILSLHIPSILTECSMDLSSTTKGRNKHWEFLFIKSMSFCANLYVRTVLTSDIRYTISTFPKETRFPLTKAITFDDAYDWYWITQPPPPPQLNPNEEEADYVEDLLPSIEHTPTHSPVVSSVADPSMKPHNLSHVLDATSVNNQSNVNNANNISTLNTSSHHASSSSTNTSVQSTSAQSSKTIHSTSTHAAPVNTINPTSSPALRNSNLNRSQSSSTSSSPNISSSSSSSTRTRLVPRPTTSSQLLPDPIMKLHKIIGHSSRASRNMCWSPDGRYIVYPSNNIIVIMDATTTDYTQSFLLGHTATINLITFSYNGLLATGQEGKSPIIRIWNFETRQCLTVLMAHQQDLRSLAFSHNNQLLAAVGRDATGRILIVVWDIENIMQNGKTAIVAKQVNSQTETNTNTIFFFFICIFYYLFLFFSIIVTHFIFCVLCFFFSLNSSLVIRLQHHPHPILPVS